MKRMRRRDERQKRMMLYTMNGDKESRIYRGIQVERRGEEEAA